MTELNITEEEAKYIRARFKTTSGYDNLIKAVPSFKIFLEELPEVKKPILYELDLIVRDALCELRGLSHGTLDF